MRLPALALLSVAVVLAAIPAVRAQGEKERLARQKLDSLGATLRKDSFGDGVHMSCSTFWRGTDADLDLLKDIPKLRGVRLYRDVTDKTLEKLKALTQLRGVELAADNITPAGLKHLSGLPALEYVTLSGRRYSGKGLAQLKGARSLRYLDLYGPIDDEGLKELHGLKQMRGLELRGPIKVTAKGLTDLRKALPGLSIRLVHE